MRKSISILLVLMGLLLCSFVTETAEVGKRVYRLANDTHVFEIYNDSTFKYKYVIDTFVDVVSEGKWRSKNGRDLILNSYEQEPPIPLIVEIKKTPDSKRARQLHVELINDKGREHDFFVIPMSNRVSLPFYSGSRGSQVIETVFLIENLSFKIIKKPEENTRKKPTVYHHKISLSPMYTNKSTEEVKLNLPPGESAYITINLKDDSFKKRIFTNTPIQIKGKDLIFRDSDSEKVIKLKQQ